MTQIAKKTTRKAETGKFIVVRRGAKTYIDGNLLLDPLGEPSVSRKRLRKAVRKVAKASK